MEHLDFIYFMLLFLVLSLLPNADELVGSRAMTT